MATYAVLRVQGTTPILAAKQAGYACCAEAWNRLERNPRIRAEIRRLSAAAPATTLVSPARAEIAGTAEPARTAEVLPRQIGRDEALEILTGISRDAAVQASARTTALRLIADLQGWLSGVPSTATVNVVNLGPLEKQL